MNGLIKLLKMNLDNIFNSFQDSIDPSHDGDGLLVDFSEHPFYWIGGFNKIISNHLYFKQYVIKQFKNSSPPLDENEIEHIGKKMMFNKAWDYIKDINLNNQFHVECIYKKSHIDFYKNLKQTIKYFEQTEEFEKCGFLKQIELKVKENLI